MATDSWIIVREVAPTPKQILEFWNESDNQWCLQLSSATRWTDRNTALKHRDNHPRTDVCKASVNSYSFWEQRYLSTSPIDDYDRAMGVL